MKIVIMKNKNNMRTTSSINKKTRVIKMIGNMKIINMMMNTISSSNSNSKSLNNTNNNKIITIIKMTMIILKVIYNNNIKIKKNISNTNKMQKKSQILYRDLSN